VVVGPGLRTALLMLLAAVGALLLIACGNVAILLMARATSRRREYAIRAGLGAGRWSIARLMLMESLLLSLAGGALGTLLSVWGVAALKYFAPADLPRLNEIQTNPAVLFFALGVSLATALLFGMAPALLFSHARFNELLKERSVGSAQAERHRTSTALVIGEMAMSLGLLAGAGLLVRSLWTLASVNPGFRADHVITATLTLNRSTYPTTAAQSDFLRRIEERISALPGVQATGAVSELPLSGQLNDDLFRIEGRDYQANQNDDADFRRTTPGYLAAMGIPLLRGRWIGPQDVGNSPAVVVVNQPFVDTYFRKQEPLGRQLRIAGDDAPRTIVGVIGGVSHFSLNSPKPPEMYLPLAQSGVDTVNIVVRAQSNSSALGLAMNDAVTSLDPNEVFSTVRSLDDVVSKSIGQPRFSAQLFGLFALLALTLAGIGLYGMIAFSVSQRTNEIGIRMALGARPGDVMKMILGRGLRLALAGTMFGLAVAAGVAWLLRGMLFGIAAADPVTFAAVASLLIMVALVAAYFPARRAMRVDPMVALRYE
jgi:putative ABC transport system permease protein